MISAALQRLTGFRNDPLVATMIFTGVDLTGFTAALVVRLYPDQGGAALISIATTGTQGAEGIRLVAVEDDADGIPESLVEIIITKAHMQALAAAPEAGAPLELYYDLQITPAEDATTGWTEAVEQTWLYGEFIVNGSANA